MGVLTALLLGSVPANGQVAPDLHWRSLHTQHFHVHFSPGLEPIARRAAGSAERSYSRLAAELHEPRGPIDLVVADNLDISNGYTTTFPTNRIVIYARPPVDASSLTFIDDWVDLVVTHELAHTFHLDRTRGWWRVAQYVFGRNPFLFPNLYEPSWLVEGIAVHYETRLTGAGRDAGTDFAMIARAKALEHQTPALNALSASTPIYPLGETAYAFGAQLIEEITSTHVSSTVNFSTLDPPTLGRFIETSSARTIPFLLNRNARAAFGITFDSAWRRWTDSVSRSALLISSATTAGLRDLGTRGWGSLGLRWSDNNTLRFGNADGRDVPALRALDIRTGVTTWVDRRNSLDVNSLGASGAMVYAQQDLTDPYTFRSDLYLERGSIEAGSGSTSVRLTHGERLMQPDVRSRPEGEAVRSYEVVAVQLAPGADRLVRVHSDGDATRITPLTGTSPDTMWSDPRWSHAGTRIAATRWIHGGTSEIVILDTLGRVLQSLGRTRSVNGRPSWSHADSAILFTSDRSGRSAIYRAWLHNGRLEKIAEAATGLFESEESPDGKWLATLHYRADGLHVSSLPSSTLDSRPSDSSSVLPPSKNTPVATTNAASTRYNPWPSLLPRYWLPAIEQSDKNRPMYGFITSGSDVIGRHQYQLQATLEPRHQEPNVDLFYNYAGLGNPVVSVGGSEVWDHLVVPDSTRKIGVPIARRKYFASTSVTFARPRVRTYTALTVGAQLEWRDFLAYPDSYFGLLTAADRAVLRGKYTYPSFFVSAGFSNVRNPTLAISYEDGFQLSATASQRWRSDDASATRSNSVVGTASAFKSLDLPGFAHHVIALRAAAGWEDDKAASEFKVGGVSGSILSIAPGVTIGDGRRTFPVRGFPASAQIGTQAMGGSVEYRAPIALPASGVLMLPLFFQRLSASAFADAATAWCPAAATAGVFCPAKGYPRDWISSAGAELALDAAYQYDVPYHFRVGAAAPVTGKAYFGGSTITVYFAVGLAF